MSEFSQKRVLADAARHANSGSVRTFDGKVFKFDNRIWSSKGMKSMEEYLAAAPWAVRWSMKDRGDFRISLVKKAKNWATTRGIPKEPAYQVYASIDSQALSHVINQEFAEWGRGR